MSAKFNFGKKVEVLPAKRKVLSAKRVLNLIEERPEKIGKIKFVYPKLGSNSLGKFIVDHEW